MKNPKWRKRTLEEKKKMFERYENGETLDSIGISHGISRERMRQIFAAAGFERRRFTMSEKLLKAREAYKIPLPEAVLRRLYLDEYKTLDEIAEVFGCSQGAVWTACKRYGIPRRARFQTNAVRPPKFPELTRENLTELYIKKNKSALEVARIIGCGRVTLFRKLEEFGIRKRKSNNDKEQK